MSKLDKRTSSTDNDYEIKLKFVILGESMVGKTSIINRYINDSFTERYLCTVGIDFQEKIVNKNNKKIKLQIWDTAGEERYRNITKSYFKACDGFIIAYDINNKQSFDQVRYWVKEIASLSDTKVNCILIGTKCDLDSSEREVDEEKGNKFAQSLGYKFLETSAKLNININEAFDTLLDEVLLNYKPNLRESVKLSKAQTKKQKKNCC